LVFHVHELRSTECGQRPVQVKHDQYLSIPKRDRNFVAEDLTGFSALAAEEKFTVQTPEDLCALDRPKEIFQ